MPRGGGGFGGGGFGGGGFRGGGGHRGGSGGFRGGGGFHRSSRPFGRTGSHRSVSRSPRGRNYYGHRRYYGNSWGWNWGWGWGYRPWYMWRPFNWYWGSYYRPWYYSPVYISSSLIILIIMLLLIVPMMGLFTIPYPTNNGGIVTYNDTETLYYNEFWYERESLTSGDQISYTMQSTVPVTFLISDTPFTEFQPSQSKKTGSGAFNTTIQRNDDYKYVQFFLFSGDSISYDFTVTNTINFFISDGQQLAKWNNWESSVSYNDYNGASSDSGSFTAPYTQDWYLVWYNPAPDFDVSVQATINYSVTQFDYSQALVVEKDTTLVPEAAVTVPKDGNWYFIIYFDPFDDNSEKVDITFYVQYYTGITDNERWVGTQPILIILVILVIILLIFGMIQRKRVKEYTTRESSKSKNETKEIKSVTTDTSSLQKPETKDIKSQKCPVCKQPYLDEDTYCVNCGTKLKGRDYGVAKKTNPKDATHCTVCGSKLEEESLFCSNCGTQRSN